MSYEKLTKTAEMDTETDVNTEFFAVMDFEANRDPQWAQRMAAAGTLASMAVFAANLTQTHFEPDPTRERSLPETD